MRHLEISKGFTLLETLVAVAILMLAIGSAFGLAPQGLIGARYAKNQTTANYLVQDALETARNIRDNNMFFSPNPADPYNWQAGLKECLDRWCSVNSVNDTLTACPGACPPLIQIDTADGGVAYGNGPLFANDPSAQTSIFTRALMLHRLNNATIGNDNTEALVTARVIWQEGSLSRETQVSVDLFDWYTASK